MTTAATAAALLPHVLAHGGRPHALPAWWAEWGFEPVVVLSLAASAWLYWLGVHQMWRAAGPGRGVRRWEARCFWGGWLALFVALVSPVHPLGRFLFSVHMTQHEILMLVAAPLLVLGRPMIPFLVALPKTWSRSLARWGNRPGWQFGWGIVTNAFVAWLIHAAALWAWHLPALFQATLENEFVHALQHVSFLGSALLFWWAVIHGRGRAMGYGMGVLYVLTTGMHSGLLGALLTFATTVWYPAYIGGTARFGLTPLEDQQIGGLIMWAPAGLAYAAAGLALFAAWLRESERRVLRHEAVARAARSADAATRFGAASPPAAAPAP
jgi:putative membrane protein